MSFIDSPPPHVFDIPAPLDFVQALAAGLRARTGPGDPLAMARVTLYVPTRRMARAVEQALAVASGRVTLVPRILPLADLDADPRLAAPPAIAPMRRRLALARLTRALAKADPQLANEGAALALADTLADLLDEAHDAGVGLDGLDALVETDAVADHAEHWARSLTFLDILRGAWPAFLRAEGALDPKARRRRLGEALIASWTEAPPRDPVIIAGDPGDSAVTRMLMEACARLDKGAVILSGLDRGIEAATFRALPEPGREGTPSHPQASLSRILRQIGIARRDVLDWVDGPVPRAARAGLWSEALRPAPVTDVWLARATSIARLAPEATADMTLIEAETAQQEAATIALVVREALETPGRTVAVVTPDRVLARRVAALLGRWGVVADDSGGRPLALTPPGVFLSLIAQAALGAGDPATLTALTKHPLTRAGEGRAAHLRLARRHEIEVLRGAQTPDEALAAWHDGIDAALAPLAALAGQTVPLNVLLQAHRNAACALAGEALWAEAAGETAQLLLEDITAAADAFGEAEGAAYPAIFESLMSGAAVRAPFGQHPRVFIWGEVEARAQMADRMILCGLNDGIWPKPPEPGPWLSRPMREAFGLPPLEARIGLSAQDFVQAACAPEVFLCRARKADGAPTVPSRWLSRLSTLLGRGQDGLSPASLEAMRARGDVWLARAAGMERLQSENPAPRPAPTPPVDTRPDALSVTEVETLIRDPYAIYARKILRLRPLDPLDAEPGASERGQAFHTLFERLIGETMHEWPENPRPLWDRLQNEILSGFADHPALQAFWAARLEAMRDWFLDSETERRETGRPLVLEAWGRHDFPLGEAPDARVFTLRAKADRIDLTEGGLAIYDYKTGAVPSLDQAKAGYAQQLPLEGAIALKGGFEGVAARPLARLAWLGCSGEGEERALDDGAEIAAQALGNLRALMSDYEHPSTPYRSRLRPQFLRFAGDYDHLARFGEWGIGAEDDDG